MHRAVQRGPSFSLPSDGMIGHMGCVTCGRRQVDPESGPSAWRRAVIRGEQVLVCPQCQGEGWTDGLDRCAACGSTVLVKRLGEVTCRGCGAVGDPIGADNSGDQSSGPEETSPGREALQREVAAALDRLLGRD